MVEMFQLNTKIIGKSNPKFQDYNLNRVGRLEIIHLLSKLDRNELFNHNSIIHHQQIVANLSIRIIIPN